METQSCCNFHVIVQKRGENSDFRVWSSSLTLETVLSQRNCRLVWCNWKCLISKLLIIENLLNAILCVCVWHNWLIRSSVVTEAFLLANRVNYSATYFVSENSRLMRLRTLGRCGAVKYLTNWLSFILLSACRATSITSMTLFPPTWGISTG